MNYDSILKEINEAVALRQLLDDVARDYEGIVNRIARIKQDIEARKNLEANLVEQESKRDEVFKALKQHEEEMDKRLAKLKKEGITLPIKAESPTPFVHS